MGLDSVELVMAFEEGFGVSISDAEAVTCRTPGDVIDLVCGKLQTSDDTVCVSQRGFHVLRRALIETLGISRGDVDLDFDIRSFASGKSDREIWEGLKTATQARSWPPLVRPSWLVGILWIVPVLVFLVLLSAAHWAIAGSCAVVSVLAASRFTSQFCSRIPAWCSKVRDLVPFAVTSNAVVWTRAQVAALVKEVVIEQLGVSEGQYREDADFISDFGMD